MKRTRETHFSTDFLDSSNRLYENSDSKIVCEEWFTMSNQCPACNAIEFVVGVFGNYARIMKPGSAFKHSGVTATVCANCGYVLQLKVDNPEKLK